MEFEIAQRIDAPRDRVEAAFVDPAFLSALAGLPKIGRPEVLDRATDGEGGRVRQRVRHRFSGHLSGAVRRVVDPDRLTWVEETVFDPARHRSDVRIVPDHYGGLLASHLTITYEEAGPAATIRRARGEMKVHMPLVGGKVEAAIVSGMREHAEAEADALTRWLRDPGSFGR